MTKTKFQMVKEFNDKVVRLEGVKVAHCLAPQRVEWFKNVLAEEVQEFQDARNADDCVGMLDALVDAAYFILGRVQECGFTETQWNKAFELVHTQNMKKHAGDKGRGSSMDAIKDKNWEGPESLIKDMLIDSHYYELDNKLTTKEIEAMVYGVKEDKPYDALAQYESSESYKALKPIIMDSIVDTTEHHEPSVYIDIDGEQLICSIEELKLFKKMSPIFKEVTKIAIKKSEDYNNGNGQPASRAQYFPFGLLSYAQMLHTKTQRLNSLAQQDKKPNNESIRDTLLDIINYATFTVEAIDKEEI